jgi:hypothetical protein
MLRRAGRCGGLGTIVLCLLTACSNGYGSIAGNAIPVTAPHGLSQAQTLRASSYYGCPVFPSTDTYNKVIATAAIDPNSSRYISSTYSAGDKAGFYASTGVFKANIANNSTPRLAVHPKVWYHKFPSPYPWLKAFFIEPLGDAHSIVVQTQTCHLYEAYSTTYSGGVLSAYSGANWDLTKPFVPMSKGQPSAMASGLPIFAGIVRWEDYQAGAVKHALNWAAIAHTVAQSKFVTPASSTDRLSFKGTSSYQMPYGARLRLHASFSTTGMGPQAIMVVKALKTYGVYLCDTGTYANALYFENASNGTNPWNASDLRSLSRIHITDFDVIKLPAIQSL